jgi:hypothetical protein
MSCKAKLGEQRLSSEMTQLNKNGYGKRERAIEN